MSLSKIFILLLLLFIKDSKNVPLLSSNISHVTVDNHPVDVQVIEYKMNPVDEPTFCGTCPPTCPPTSELNCENGTVLDGCSCCQTCPSQLGQQCSILQVCDAKKDLFCDYHESTCRRIIRKKCYINGRVYSHNEELIPTCDQACRCNDGFITCINKCPRESEVEQPDNCNVPHFSKTPTECCPRWICTDENVESDLYSEEISKVDRPTLIEREGCTAQITNWSQCSASCGFGTSSRINSDNANCEMRKQIRFCEIRPCPTKNDYRRQKKNSPDWCEKTWRHRSHEQIEIDGCLSEKKYRLRYCRSCDGFCCRPMISKTFRGNFNCPSKDVNSTIVNKSMMLIKKCQCTEGSCDVLRMGKIMRDD